MAERINNRLTPVTPQQFLGALYHAWLELLGSPPPKKESLLVLMAQSALETGRWKFVHDYNLGNAKSVEGDGHDYCYYACNEILDAGAAAAYEAKSTPDASAKVTEKRSDGLSVIWFYPNHPACRFRAFCVKRDDGSLDEEASLLAGMTDYLGLLYKKYSIAWKSVLQGDPVAFCAALKAAHYFTADLNEYMRGVVSLFNEFRTIPFDMDAQPVLNASQKTTILNLVQSTNLNSVREEIEAAQHAEDDVV